MEKHLLALAATPLSFTGSLIHAMKSQWAGAAIIVGALAAGWVARDFMSAQANMPHRVMQIERTVNRFAITEAEFNLLVDAICSKESLEPSVMRACIMIEGIERQRGNSGS